MKFYSIKHNKSNGAFENRVTIIAETAYKAISIYVYSVKVCPGDLFYVTVPEINDSGYKFVPDDEYQPEEQLENMLMKFSIGISYTEFGAQGCLLFDPSLWWAKENDKKIEPSDLVVMWLER